jgi:hypothetical protein
MSLKVISMSVYGDSSSSSMSVTFYGMDSSTPNLERWITEKEATKELPRAGWTWSEEESNIPMSAADGSHVLMACNSNSFQVRVMVEWNLRPSFVPIEPGEA